MISVPDSDIARLAADFRGALLRPGADGYETARRVWNAEVDRRPALIARCSGVSDVVAAIRYARERDLLVAVRGGGHSVAGNAVCDDGMVVDLSPMKGIRVDPARRLARAQAGVLWGELDRETQLFGLATPGGVVSHTGIAGLTLGGGIGWLMRKYGATVDNLQAVDLVTAAGDIVTADEGTNRDLFWGLRGGGGNFGVSTSFVYRLHRVGPTVVAGSVFFRFADAQDVLRQYRDWAATAPDEVTTIVSLRLAPPMPYLPQAVHGEPVVYISACHCGDLESAARALEPLASFAEPIATTFGAKPFVEHQRLVDAWSPPGWHYYWRSCELPPLTDGIINVLIEHTGRMRWPKAKTNIYQFGGALGQVSDEATAYYSDRRPSHNISINAVWAEGDDDPAPMKRWADEFQAALAPCSMEREYVNFLTESRDERIRAAYGPDKYARLVALKRRYDPTNVFHLNVNINPAAELAATASPGATPREG